MAREPGVPVSHKAVTASSGHSGGSFRTVRLAALNLRAGHLRLSSQRFAERIHRNRRVLDLDDLEMLRLRWRAQVHAVARARLDQRIGERRAPADVAAVEVHLVDTDDRDDVFEAGGVGAAGSTTTAASMRFVRKRIRESIWPNRRLP